MLRNIEIEDPVLGAEGHSELTAKLKFLKEREKNRIKKGETLIGKLAKKSAKIVQDQRQVNNGSPYRFKNDKVSFQTNSSRREKGNGRLNRLFSNHTPTLQDKDIKHLLAKYPVDINKSDNPDSRPNSR